MKNNNKWRILIIAFLILIILLYFQLNINEYFTFDSLKNHREWLIAVTQSNYFTSVIVFILLYIACVTFSLPVATFLTLISGFLYGSLLGTIYVVISATIGAYIAFCAIKFTADPILNHQSLTWLRKVEDGFKHNAFQYLLTLRLIPLFPFWFVNIAPALLRIPSSTYIVATFFGIIPGSFIYVLLGSGLGKLLDENKTPDLSIIFRPYIILPLMALALLSFTPALIHYLRKGHRHE